MTVANRIAAGSSQKRWLAETLTAEGLDPTDGKYGRYSRALWRRIAAFVDNLTLAGYAIQELPLGPDGSSRVVMTGYVPAACPSDYRHPRQRQRDLEGAQPDIQPLPAARMVDEAGPEVVRVATTLSPWFTGSLEDVLAVAPGVALGHATT